MTLHEYEYPDIKTLQKISIANGTFNFEYKYINIYKQICMTLVHI